MHNPNVLIVFSYIYLPLMYVSITVVCATACQIVWADQQKAHERHKRDYLRQEKKEVVVEHSKRSQEDYRSRGSSGTFNDELWEQEWYLVTICACSVQSVSALIVNSSLMSNALYLVTTYLLYIPYDVHDDILHFEY